MDPLFSRITAIDVVPRQLPGGEVVHLREVRISFDQATPGRLPAGTLSRTYQVKPLLTFDGEILFGELAVLRCLQLDGWDGRWVDSFHRRKFWQDMPHHHDPSMLPVHAQELYDRIVAANGGRAAGFFDVMAGRGTRSFSQSTRVQATARIGMKQPGSARPFELESPNKTCSSCVDFPSASANAVALRLRALDV